MDFASIVSFFHTMAFEGTIVPRTWYRTFETVTPTGRQGVDLAAIHVLAEIVRCYRSTRHVPEDEYPVRGSERSLLSDKLQVTYESLASRLGLSRNQTKRAVRSLVKRGLISVVFRRASQRDGVVTPKTLVIEPIPHAIFAITHPGVPMDYVLPSVTTVASTGDSPGKRSPLVRSSHGGAKKRRIAERPVASQRLPDSCAHAIDRLKEMLPASSLAYFISDDPRDPMPDDMIVSRSEAICILCEFVEAMQAADKEAGTVTKYLRSLSKWALEFEKLLRMDKRDPVQVLSVIQWLFYSQTRNAVFWRCRIRSGTTFRMQYEALVSSYQSGRTRRERGRMARVA